MSEPVSGSGPTNNDNNNDKEALEDALEKMIGAFMTPISLKMLSKARELSRDE